MKNWDTADKIMFFIFILPFGILIWTMLILFIISLFILSYEPKKNILRLYCLPTHPHRTA